MKFRGIVKDVKDPKDFGRIRVELVGYDKGGSITPWCWPCSVFAGPGYGFYCMPVSGDEVYVEKTVDGDFVWVGFCWSGRNKKPDDGKAPDVRVFRTPVGHQLKFDESGDIKLDHSNGSFIVIRQNGNIEIMATGKDVWINDNGIVKCVNTMSICSFTGLVHPQGSKSVYSEKP